VVLDGADVVLGEAGVVLGDTGVVLSEEQGGSLWARAGLL